MAKFFVGQRVRIRAVAKPVNRHMIGMEARIVGFVFDGELASLDIRHLANEGWWIGVENLEPIIDDGRQLTTWDAMRDLGLWAPEREGVRA